MWRRYILSIRALLFEALANSYLCNKALLASNNFKFNQNFFCRSNVDHWEFWGGTLLSLIVCIGNIINNLATRNFFCEMRNLLWLIGICNGFVNMSGTFMSSNFALIFNYLLFFVNNVIVFLYIRICSSLRFPVKKVELWKKLTIRIGPRLLIR